MSNSEALVKKLCLDTAKRSPCNKRKVGALVVDKDTLQIVGAGWNYNSITKDGSCCETEEGKTKASVFHAEISAIEDYKTTWNTYGGLDKCVMYVTHPPCNNCLAEIKKHNIKEVIIVEDFMKFDTNKLRYDLIPTDATKALAEVLTYGAKKYKPNNWQNVDDKGRYIAALYRHLEAWRSGEFLDEESKLQHLAHAMTNIAFLLYFENKEKENA